MYAVEFLSNKNVFAIELGRNKKRIFMPAFWMPSKKYLFLHDLRMDSRK